MLVGLVLAAMVLVAGTLAFTGWAGPVVLLALSIGWLVVNKPMEGAVLYTFAPGRGLTAGDLVSVAGVVVAALRLLVLFRGR